MSTKTFVHRFGSTLDYGWNWGDGVSKRSWLAAGETISTANVQIVSDAADLQLNPTAIPQTIVGGVVRIGVTGGTPGTLYVLQCRITTSQGRTEDALLAIAVEQVNTP